MVPVCAHNPPKGLHAARLFQPIVGHDFGQLQGTKAPTTHRSHLLYSNDTLLLHTGFFPTHWPTTQVGQGLIWKVWKQVEMLGIKARPQKDMGSRG